MVYPSLPPNLPLTVAKFPSASVVSTNSVDPPSRPDVEQVKRKQTQSSQSLNQLNNAKDLGTEAKKDEENGVVAKHAPLASSSSPEQFPPEFTPGNVQIHSAKLLGPALSVKFPIASIADANKFLANQNIIHNHTDKNQQERNIAEKKLLLTQQKSKNKQVKNVTEPTDPTPLKKQEITTTPQTKSNPTLRVKFNTQSPREQQRPGTIEFKSRAQVDGDSRVIDLSGEEKSPSTQQPRNNSSETTQTTQTTQTTPRIIEVVADRQEYDERRRVVTAEGNVIVRFDGALMDADRVQVSLDNLIAVGSGNVALTRGEQILRGQRFVYNFIQDSGEIQRGSGEIYIPNAGSDLSFTPSVAGAVQTQPLSDRIRQQQPLTGVSSPGSININAGGRPNASNLNPPPEGGEIKRIRFEAAKIDFFPRGLEAEDVRLTNDPFSPPELEVRANRVTVTRKSPLEDVIRTQGQRLVFDGGLSIPIPRNQQIIDRREREATPWFGFIGFDGDRRGGLFVQRQFQPVNTATTQLSLTPQFYAQKAFNNSDGNFADLFGLRSELKSQLTPKTRVEGRAIFDTLDLSDIDDRLRANLRLQQVVGDTRPHLLNLDANYRDRLYNGTLGFQRVQSSLGGVILSPIIPLGQSGLNLTYQAGAQYIRARTDRLDLLEPIRDNDLISLGRLQANAKLFGTIPMWRGKALEPTPTAGVKYTPNSILPYINAFGEVNGTTTYYTNGDSQNTLIGSIGVEGQIGNFSKPLFDYTGFRVSYSQGLRDGSSPFLFDRFVDNRLLNLGFIQQIYGPFRFGFQTSLNLDNGRSASTEYTLEYSRRSYGITLRYNPVLELGGISFRISDFNWSGGTDPFSGRGEFTPVVGGVEQR